MDTNDKLRKIVEYKKLKGSIRKPKYATRKLSIGLVSCMLGYALLVSPNSVEAAAETTDVVAEEKATSPEKDPVEESSEVTDEAKEEPVTYNEENLDNLPVEDIIEGEKTEETPAEAKEEFKLTDEQVSKLKEADFTLAEIEDIEKEAKSKKEADERFDVESFLDEKIADKKESQDKETLEVSEDGADKKEAQRAGEEASAANAVEEGEFTEDEAKENWDKHVQDKSRWEIGENQRLRRVGFSDPIKMTDVDYDGVFVDEEGNTVIRLVYKERSSAATGVWYRARFNFGELDQFIDYDKSYVVGADTFGSEKGTFNLTQVNDRKEREFDLGVARHDPTDARLNLPINLVLRDKMTVADLGNKNYTVQMRLTNSKGNIIYAYAPGKTAMDYSTYTKTTSVALEDNINNTFLKGGKQTDGQKATSQETFFSEFIANPKEYSDKSQLGIIRTQYYGVRSATAASPTVGGQQIGFTQVFDKNLVNFLKAD